MKKRQAKVGTCYRMMQQTEQVGDSLSMAYDPTWSKISKIPELQQYQNLDNISSNNRAFGVDSDKRNCSASSDNTGSVIHTCSALHSVL